MNENGGSIPTDSEEWTLNLLYFYLDAILALNEEIHPKVPQKFK